GKRHDPAIDLGASAVMADLGVYAVGEVQRRGALGQVDGVTVGSEHIHPVRIDIHAQLLGQAADIAQLLVPLEHLTQPGDLLFVVAGAGLSVGTLVTPVGADTQLGLFVHGVAADLHLQDLAIRSDDRRVQRAVAVFLGVGDVVVELLGNVPPQGVHDAQRGVAVVDFRNQHAHRKHVVDLAQLQAFFLHFSPDGINMLGAPTEIGLDTGGGQLFAQLVHHMGDVLLAIQAPRMQQGSDLLVLPGLQVAEGEVFQLPLDMLDSQAMGQRRVNIEHFAGNAVAFFIVGILDRPDRAGALGQLDQRHTHIIDHGHQHLAQVFHLGLGAEHQRIARVHTGADRRHAQHAFDQLGDHRAEVLGHVLEADLAFAHAPINDRRLQRILVDAQVGENLGDFQTSAKAGRALGPQILRRVGLLLGRMGELAGTLQSSSVQSRIKLEYLIEPGFQIDAAVGIDGLMRSDLYHFYLPLRHADTPK